MTKMKKPLTYRELSSVTYVSPDGLVIHTDKKIVFEKGRGDVISLEGRVLGCVS